MEDRSNLPYFFLGIGVGLAVGMLFAPKSGEETRAMIKDRADESRDFLRKKHGEFRETADDFLERGREAVSRQREQVSAAVDAGRQAYREALGNVSAGSQGV